MRLNDKKLKRGGGTPDRGEETHTRLEWWVSLSSLCDYVHECVTIVCRDHERKSLESSRRAACARSTVRSVRIKYGLQP